MSAATDSIKTVLIVDDHRVMAQGLSILLKNDPRLEVCGTAASFEEAQTSVAEMQPDVVLVDLNLGDGNGLDLIRELHRTHPNIFTLVLSSQDENVFAGRCIRAGAKGYLMKKSSFDIIIAAIKKVIAGDLFVSENIKQQLMQQSMFGGSANSTDVDQLSDREFEIFQLIGEGFRQRQIADKLCISATTVNKHCQNMKTKLHLESMDELVNQSIEWFQHK